MKIAFPDALASRIFQRNTVKIIRNSENISSTKTWRKYFFLLPCLIGIALLPGCKDPEEIGLGVIPGSDSLGVAYSDTTVVLTRSLLEDTLRSDELSVQLLGGIYDPVFGKHEAAVFAHMFSFDPSPLASMTFVSRPNTQVVVDSDSVAPALRIPLSLVLADSIMALNGQSQLSSNDSWNDYFKGLYIRTNPPGTSGMGCISYFNFLTSKMTLYYHDTDSLIKSYSFTLAGARVNSFSHDYTGTSVASQVADSTAIDSLAFIQSMAGVKTKFHSLF
ncbi:MAG: DUF4270 family protein [Bacteroidetes bacterium]|nr:DUF4270 family protein [Bacteroidota bacterium]